MPKIPGVNRWGMDKRTLGLLGSLVIGPLVAALVKLAVVVLALLLG